MRLLRCPRCRHVAWLESLTCEGCGLELGFHPHSLTLAESDAAGVAVDGLTWVPCANRGLRCNWLAKADAEGGECFACRLTRRRPASYDSEALAKLAETSVAKRRMLAQLATLGLPIETYHEREGGLAFDLLSSRSGQGQIRIGHASGVITIDLVESLDDYREAMRIKLDEPYRTMLGHFRHEVAHYYQWNLVEQTHFIDECRALFGDERASYRDAIDRHYREGPPAGWQASFISAYATMHPWEDFAETFAHYLHISDTLATVAVGGVVLRAERVDGLLGEDVVPRQSYLDAPVEEMLRDWRWLSMLLNRASRAMGKGDLYPFTIVEPVVRKFAFVHKVVQDANAATVRPILD